MSKHAVRSLVYASLMCSTMLLNGAPSFGNAPTLNAPQGIAAGEMPTDEMSAIDAQLAQAIEPAAGNAQTIPQPLDAVQSKAENPTAYNNVRESLSGSLRDAIGSGIQTNPEYKAVKAGRNVTDSQLRQGKARYLPTLDLNADYGYEHTSNVSTRARNNGGSEGLWRSQASLTLTQMLFDGFETKYEVERQKARVVSSAHRINETTELLGLTIAESYLDVLRQRYLSSISQENINDHRAILEQIEAGVQGGRSTQADLQQARARLESSQATRADILEALESAESKYYREVGTEPGDLIMPTVPYSSLRSTLEEEITYALSTSPTLSIFESDIEVAYAEARGTQAAYYPELDLQVSAGYGNHLNGVESYEEDVSALVVMNWNLYRGGGDMAREREFRYRHEQAKAQYSDAARDLEDEVRRTWAGMIAAGTRAEKYTSQAEANEQVVNAYTDQFTLNRRTLLDVLDSQNELFVSKTNKINSEFVQMFSVYRLLALRGELLSTLGVEHADPGAIYTASVEWADKHKVEAR